MEEQIIKILKLERSSITTNTVMVDPEQIAFEITSMVMEFIEWKDEHTSIIYHKDGIYGKWYGFESKYWLPDKLFEHWFNNIRNK